MIPRILAVDDEPLIRESIKMALIGSRFELDVAANSSECLRLVRQNPLRYAVVFVDYNLPAILGQRDSRGDFVARRLKEINPNITTVMISGDQSPEAFNSWIAAEVDQFIYKPFQAHQIRAIAESSCSKHEEALGLSFDHKPRPLDSNAVEALRKIKLVSTSQSMARAALIAATYATNSYNVLILGETGTGKEMIAKGIHDWSDRSKKPFLPINCSSFANSENLLESELFGHEKGSFTGADRLKIGVFESVQGGVVFLDEIHHLGPNAQKKLLRVIQERKVRRVGGTVEIPVNFRLIAAGKPEIKEMSRSGEFTPDLYYRVKELLLELPPLRERREDVRALVTHFKSTLEHDLNRTIHFSDSSLEVMQNYAWPGNVRELENLVKELLVTINRPVIYPTDLPKELHVKAESEFIRNGRLVPFNFLVAEQELQQRLLIVTALKETGNNISQAAAKLEIARSTMRDLIKKYHVTDGEIEEQVSSKMPSRKDQSI